MKLFITLLVTSCLHVALPAQDRSSNADKVSPLEKLSWLAGHWLRETPRSISEEVWLPPRSTLALGMNRSVAASGKCTFEYMRIEAREAGIFYIASPSGQSTTEFHLTQVTESLARFENPQHDFPKVIQYERQGDLLTAKLFGDNPTQEAKVQFEWKLQSPVAN